VGQRQKAKGKRPKVILVFILILTQKRTNATVKIGTRASFSLVVSLIITQEAYFFIVILPLNSCLVFSMENTPPL